MKPIFNQTWALSAVLLNMAGLGMVLSFTTCLLAALRSTDSEIHIDLNIASWLGSSVGLAGIPGYMFSAYLMNWKGRRLTHAVVLLPGMIGWIFIYFASDVTTLMIGRNLGGLTVGGTVCLGAIVVGEYSSPNNRGMFLNLKTASFCLGGLIIHFLGHFFYWRTVALIAVLPYPISLFIIYTWPESPSWLASKKEFKKCEDAFYWLRGKSETSQKELEELIRSQKDKPDYKRKITVMKQFKGLVMKFTKRDFIKPMIIIFLSAFLIEASGRHIFPAYALQIIGEVTGSKSQLFYYTLAIDVIITTSATFSSVLVKIFKRRTLLFASGFSSLFVLFCVCAFIYLLSVGRISKNYSIVPIALLMTYFLLVNLGCTAIPLSLLGEVLPLSHRGVGTALSGLILSLLSMLALQVTPYLLDGINVHGTYAVFGSAMGITLVIFYFVLPETKDRTLQEIEEYFKYGQFKEENEIEEEDTDAKIKMIS
ncbi:facilitated trehalose transporter Tret1-like [Battus philenor]|uniref:facilitated trehalose transporter Tret1-like n=1 Tax=Battus philenor TaxID=42288 RepID=UPI0035CFFE0E